ncbi:hypothetical protein [Erythrobacter sp. R86502]|uniref:hypothetical protein n=1 Tax=Erythrobacter sp. R86502 TaxID=3093846 RepID=UPI0036D2564C
MPEAWQQGLDQILEWLDLDLPIAVKSASTRLGQLAEWAAPGLGAECAAVFAPWRVTSPAMLQNADGGSALQVTWLASYLFDYGAGKLPRGGPLDLVLMSPHPSACDQAQAGYSPLPRARLMRTMIAAAKAEGRRKLAIIVDAGSRNAMISQLLLADRSLTRDGIEIEILSVEDALGVLVRQLDCWDALIVMPQWRSIIFALLAELSRIKQPWPLLWYRRGLQLVTSEAIGPRVGKQALDAPLLVLGLIAAMRQQGQPQAAQQLYEGAAQLWDRGIATPGRPSVAPYAHHLSDEEFLLQVIKAAPAKNHRPIQRWGLLTGLGPQESARLKSDLRLVVPE